MAVLVSNACSSSYGRLTYIFNNVAHYNDKTNHRVLACSGTNIRMLHNKEGHLTTAQNGAYLEKQFHQSLKRAFNPNRKTQCQSIIISFSDDEFDTSDLSKQASQALQLAQGYVHQHFNDAQTVSCVQCDGKGGRLHVHLLVNAVKPSGKTVPTNEFSVFKMRRELNTYLNNNFERVTGRVWQNPFNEKTIRKDLQSLPSRSKWEEHLKTIIDTVKLRVTNAKSFISVLSQQGITVTKRKQGHNWTYHQIVTTNSGKTKEMKARDFYQRFDKNGKVLSTRGLGIKYTKQGLEKYWQNQLIKDEQLEEQRQPKLSSHNRKEVDKNDGNDVQSEQIEKFKSIAKDAQARANQQQLTRQLAIRQLNAETKEYNPRVKQQNRPITGRGGNKRRLKDPGKQRRANELATRKLEELKRRQSNAHSKDAGPDF